MFQDVLDFWFNELTPEQWWVKDEELDQKITARFAEVHRQASRCELFSWRTTAHGRLAEIIVLDQFSRNMFRGKPESFAWDALALALSQEAISAGAEQSLTPVERSFLYLPFMHSESLVIHERAVELYTSNGIAENLDFEIQHQNILKRFGRYPHRNAILGRASTQEELEFLQQPNSSF